MIHAVLFLSLAPALQEAPPVVSDALPRAQVVAEETPDGPLVSVVARDVDAVGLLRRLARATGRELVGADELSRAASVDVKLERRALEDAARWIAGTAGFGVEVTSARVHVFEDLPPYPTRAELFRRANTHYFRALVAHPRSAEAPRAAWFRAEIEDSTPGRALEAARSYDVVVEDHPDSDLVPDALLHAGIAYGRAGAWDEAAARFDRLASLPTPHAHFVEARLRLAEAHTQLAESTTNDVARRENARRALLVLEALDDVSPTQVGPERRARYLVRGRAYALADRPVEALRALDLAARYSVAGDRDLEVLALRARALDRAGRHGDASRAWLRHSQAVEGDARGDSLARAAESANEGGHHLTAIAIARSAEEAGFGDRLAPAADVARVALGLTEERLDLFGDVQRLERGERLLAQGLHEEAAEALRPVFDRRAMLEREARLRLALAYAEALGAEERVEDALLVLRRSARELDRVSDRRRLYLAASNLLEETGDLDRAIRALAGEL